MLPERYFFEIPIYRCSQATHISEIKKEEQELHSGETKARQMGKHLRDKGSTPDDQQLRSMFQVHPHLVLEEWRFVNNCLPWRYNQIVGWIRLYVLGTQIRGEYYFTLLKRIIRGTRPKCLFHQGKAFELSFEPSFSSQTICNEVLAAIDDLRRERPFKGRYFDLEAFENCAPYINWHSLLYPALPVE